MFSAATNLSSASFPLSPLQRTTKNVEDKTSRDSLNLHQHILGQSANLHAASGGLRLAKELRIELVNSCEIPHRFQEDRSLQNGGDGGVGSGEEGSDVLEDLFLPVSPTVDDLTGGG